MSSNATARYRAIIKVNCYDQPDRQAQDIEEGIAYAASLLMDDYGRDVGEVISLLERLADDLQEGSVR